MNSFMKTTIEEYIQNIIDCFIYLHIFILFYLFYFDLYRGNILISFDQL